MPDDERPPGMTPWGEKEDEAEAIPGFWMVSTPGHGGLYLDAEQRAAIPENLKARSADGKGAWWEEDCAWSLPVIYLLSQRSEASLSDEEKEVLDDAHEVARDYYPDEWENLTGRKIEAGESFERDQEVHLIERTGNLVVGTAWGSSSASWVPEGMVGVAAFLGKEFLGKGRNSVRSGEARYFLVPENEYVPGLFVVDPARHQEVTGKEGTPPTQTKEAKAERLKSHTPADEPQRDRAQSGGTATELTVHNLLEDPWLVLDHPLPEGADPQLLKAARAAAVVCRYEAEDLIRSSPNDPHARDLKKIDTIFTDIRHRLGEPEPVGLPLEPKMEATLDELEKTWDALRHKERDRER